MNQAIKRNQQIHDAIIRKYERGHGEIFNPVEQARLHEALRSAVNDVTSGSSAMTALDIGAGSGNLTKHLLDLGLQVTAADVSPGALKFVKERFPSVAETSVLNGVDLSQWHDHTFDFVAAYSVLHHVPDYLKLVKDMARVIKPGGAVFIDHEHSESHWSDVTYKDFADKAKQAMPYDWSKWFSPRRYYSRLRKLFDPRFHIEGDIHVFVDDHIEWNKVEAVLKAEGLEIVEAKDYLVYKTGYPTELYSEFARKCSDMRLLVARKIRPRSWDRPLGLNEPPEK